MRRQRQLCEKSRLYAVQGRQFCSLSLSLSLSLLLAQDEVALAASTSSTIDVSSSVTRQINLVLDDSGSMMFSGTSSNHGEERDRWCRALYSLEVFAAMLGPNDTLNIYLLNRTGVTLTMSGKTSATDRVAKVHDLQMIGAQTPYSQVQVAMDDLTKASANQKWLIILSDGVFTDGVTADKLQGNLNAYVNSNNTASESFGVKVAFLGIEDEAPKIAPDDKGIFYRNAVSSADILQMMIEFSRIVFERDSVPKAVKTVSDSSVSIEHDIDLAEVVVFAQGSNVNIGDAKNNKESIQAIDKVEVAWSNPPASDPKAKIDYNLKGKIATFTGLESGTTKFEVAGAQDVEFFFVPKVKLAVKLTDAAGNSTNLNDNVSEIFATEYTVEFGLVNERGDSVESKLLGDVTYSSKLLQNDTTRAAGFKSGEKISLPQGKVELDIAASYLKYGVTNAQVSLDVKPPLPLGKLDAEGDSDYYVSKLNDYKMPQDGITMSYVHIDKTTGAASSFTQAEWDAIPKNSLYVKSDSDAKVEFDIIKSDVVSEVIILPKAYHGDIFDTDTGTINATAYSTDENTTPGQFSINIIDDLSSWDRFWHWFWTFGIWLLIFLILLVIICGYLFKKRFSKRLNRKPEVSGVSKRAGIAGYSGRGSFKVDELRKYLPFVADKAILMYAPRDYGFKPLRVKAVANKNMIIENFDAIAKAGNVSIAGTTIDSDTPKNFRFNLASNIEATGTDIDFICRLSS